MINWIKKHWEVLSYLVFGVLCTLLNIVLYALFNKLFGYTAANSWGNVLDNIICILFAYCTNRAFVFRSKTQGKAMAREFGAFVTCRLGTVLLDTAIMLVLGNLLEGLAIVCGALYTVTARHLSARYSPLQITLVQSLVGLGFFGTLCLLAPSTAEPVNLGLDLPSWAPWACVVYLGCVVSLGGYGLYNVGVHGLSAAQAAAYTNLIPVMTLIIGVCFLHEVFLPSQYAASLLVIAGVLLSQWRRRG